MFFDGSKRQQGAGAGVVLISPKGTKLKYVLQINFSHASNNEAEYEALLHGMRMTRTPVPPGVFLESINRRSIKVQAATPEAFVDGEDATEITQVAAATPSEGTSTSTSDSTAPTEFEGPV